MNAPYFVEILSSANDVRHRHKVNALPIKIGRGYGNDVILDDPFVATSHAIIEESPEGEMIIRNLGNKNSIIHKGYRKKEFLFDGNDIFQIGHTLIRVRPSDFPVPDEIADSRWHGFEGRIPALMGLVLIICLTGTAAFMEDTEKFQALKYLITILTVLGAGMIWCGIWAFVSRVIGGNARLGRHILILGSGLLVMETWDYLSGLCAYALSFELLTRYGEIIEISLFAGMVYVHLMHVRPNRSRLYAASSTALAVTGSLIVLIVNYNNHGRSAGEVFMSEHFPPQVRLSHDYPLSKLFTDTAALKSKVDADRKEIVRADDSNDDEEED